MDSKPFNPGLGRIKRKNSHEVAYDRAPKQERETLAKVRGQATAGSGSRYHKGDVKVKNIARIECKATRKDSFSINRRMFEILEETGRLHDEMPAMMIEFLKPDGALDYEVAVIKTKDLVDLIKRVQDGEGAGTTDQRSGGRAKQHRGNLGARLR